MAGKGKPINVHKQIAMGKKTQGYNKGGKVCEGRSGGKSDMKMPYGKKK